MDGKAFARAIYSIQGNIRPLIAGIKIVRDVITLESWNMFLRSLMLLLLNHHHFSKDELKHIMENVVIQQARDEMKAYLQYKEKFLSPECIAYTMVLDEDTFTEDEYVEFEEAYGRDRKSFIEQYYDEDFVRLILVPQLSRIET